MREGQEIRVYWKELGEITPYENNPRNNEAAVDYVMNSIKEFGFRNPIILDSEGVIIAGHTRYKAAKKLKMKTVPCVYADDLTEEQVKAFRLADNKTAEVAEWDDDLLAKEIKGIIDIDLQLFGFVDEDCQLGADLPDDTYTMNVNIPQYEVTGEEVEISDMLDTSKTDELIEDIMNTDGITEEERAFMVEAAKRHNVFNYRKVAEYYAKASPAMQELMEKSALVIIDVGNAIANGYATLNAEVLDIMGEDNA